MIERAGAVLPFGCEQVFDIAADVERYPEFLPWWISAQVLRRTANGCEVHQVVGAGPVRVEFDSKAVFDRPRRIDVTSADPLFRRYELTWLVTPRPAGCSIGIAVDFELRSRLLQRVLGGLLPGAADGIVRAFDARVHALAGARGAGARGAGAAP